MAEHMNAFKGLINQITSLKVRLADMVLMLLLFGFLSDNSETIVVTLGNAQPEGKHLSLARVKSGLLNEKSRRKVRESGTDSKTLVMEVEMKVKGEATKPNRKRFQREKAHRQSQQVRRSHC